MPPDIKPQTSRTIRIEDIDRGVKQWFDKVVDVAVSYPDNVRRKVAVKFASGERWVASADNAGIRDKDGRLILPVIQIRRTGVDPMHNMSGLGANVPRLQLAKLVSAKTSDLANLDASRPISSRRLRDSAVYDIFTIPFPSNNILTYKVRVQSQYQHQANEIIEKIMTKLEFFNVPSFVISLSDDVREKGIKTGAGSAELIPAEHAEFSARKPLKDYYVVGYLEDNLSDDGNLEEFTDQERIIQMQFSFKVPVVLMLDPDGERPAVQTERTAFTVGLFGEEVHVTENQEEADKIFGTEK